MILSYTNQLKIKTITGLTQIHSDGSWGVPFTNPSSTQNSNPGTLKPRDRTIVEMSPAAARTSRLNNTVVATASRLRQTMLVIPNDQGDIILQMTLAVEK